METNDEAAAFAEFTLYLDSAVMQFDDTFRESQSDTGTNAGGKAIHLFGLIETVEYLIYLFGVDAAAGISHASMAKLGKNENVTTDVLVKICTALQCDIGDIMELTPENSK